MDEYSDNTCPICDEEELTQVDGEWYCSNCHSVSDFSLVPERETFSL